MKQQDRQAGHHKLEVVKNDNNDNKSTRNDNKSTKNDNRSNLRSISSGGNSLQCNEECCCYHQKEAVVCGSETPGNKDYRLTKSQSTNGANRSSNARDDDDDDDSRISSVVRAFRMSRIVSGSSVHFDDESIGKFSEETSGDEDTTDTNAYRQGRSKTTSYDHEDCCRRWKDKGERTFSEDKALIVLERSTGGGKKQDRVWSSYHEDRCSDYNNGDDSDVAYS